MIDSLVDAITHVTLGRDRRTYRFLADTRLGRSVLAESPEIKPVADQVTRYIAERMVERQRLVEGTVEPVARIAARARWGSIYRPRHGWRAFLHGLLLVIAGALVGLAFAAAYFWDRLAELG